VAIEVVASKVAVVVLVLLVQQVMVELEFYQVLLAHLFGVVAVVVVDTTELVVTAVEVLELMDLPITLEL
jgi:hypothetical protein